jgi:2-phosphosulfolactate phosphatase
MRIEVLFTPAEITEAAVKGKTVAVIDVLRACTTIAFALSRGCSSIVPVASVEAATSLVASLDRNVTLLGGEREGKRIDGFDLGNSPAEYTAEIVKRKTLVLATTNGTRAVSMSEGAREIVITSFVNMGSVVDHAAKLEDEDLTIVCAGKNNRFALEDAVCAGMVIERLCKDKEAELNDGAQAARGLYKQNEESITALLRECEHGRYLEGLGFARDLEICSRVDSLSILPLVKQGRIGRPRKPRKK